MNLYTMHHIYLCNNVDKKTHMLQSIRPDENNPLGISLRH